MSRINIVPMTNISKAISRFNGILIKIPTEFFTDLERTTFSASYGNTKKPRVAKMVLIIKKLLETSPLSTPNKLQSYTDKNSMVLSQKQTP